MEIGDKFLMNIIFDELAVLCQFYETRKCKFRKCHKYFIAKKGKEKNYCCKDCADKEIKYQIREVRRSKRERSCQKIPPICQKKTSQISSPSRKMLKESDILKNKTVGGNFAKTWLSDGLSQCQSCGKPHSASPRASHYKK